MGKAFYNTGEIEYIGYLRNIRHDMFKNIIITSDMAEKIDLFIYENRDTIIEHRSALFNVATIIKQVKSIVESPDTIWMHDGMNPRLDFFITKDFYIKVIFAKNYIAVFLFDTNGIGLRLM